MMTSLRPDVWLLEQDKRPKEERKTPGMRSVIAYGLCVAVVIRRNEQVPDNRLREAVKFFYYLVVLTLCDCDALG